MRQGLCILVALSLCGAAHAGVKVDGKDFDPQYSAALFVGVRDFTDVTLAPVPYALDDAVDLAYEFAIQQQPPSYTRRTSCSLCRRGSP
jgi:hypothetical protein